MRNIPESDQKLSKELREILDRVLAMRDGLYTSRPGCACDDRRLCAHHAAVWNHLNKLRTNFHRAIDQVEKS